MGIFYLITSLIALAVGSTLEKLNFRRNHIGARQSLFVIFVGMTITVGLFVLLSGQPWPELSLTAGILLLLIALFSFGGNVFDELSLKTNDLSLREPLTDFQPILAGLIAYMIFPAEQKPIFLVAFALGAIIVYWGTHRRKLGKGQRKGMLYLLVGTCLYAVLPTLYQETLQYVDPAWIALFRVAAVLTLVTLFFHPKKWQGFAPKGVGLVTIAALAYGVAAIVSLYAIEVYGAVITMLFLMLKPTLHYLAGKFILHEKVRKGEVISSLLLTIVVVIAALAG